MDDLCIAFELEPFTFEKGVDVLRTYGERSVFELLLAFVRKVMPTLAADGTLAAYNFPQLLDAVDTREKAAALLLQIPDEKADKLAGILKELQLLLPALKGELKKATKRLPNKPSGRKRLRSSPEDLQRIRKAVAGYVERGWSLPRAKKKVAKDEKISMPTFARRWRESEVTDQETDLK